MELATLHQNMHEPAGCKVTWALERRKKVAALQLIVELHAKR